MACMKKDWLHEEEQCNALYEAPCPCPEVDGVTCKSSEKCERNNWINNDIITPPQVEPESIEDNVWYESVEHQIPVDVPEVPLALPSQSPAPSVVHPPVYPFPASEVRNQDNEQQMPNARRKF
jgi:hypothetical protein